MLSRRLVRPAVLAGLAFHQKMSSYAHPKTYKQVSSLRLENPVLSALPITSDKLATGDWFGAITVLGPESPVTLQQPRAVMSIAKLTDDTFATSEQGRVRVWDTTNQKELRVFGAEESCTIAEMVGFPNGLLAVVRWGSDRVQIWDSNTGVMKWSLDGHMDDVKYIAKLRHNRLASYGWDDTVRIWNVENGDCERVIASGYSGSLTALPDDRLVTNNLRGVQIWSDGQLEKEIIVPRLPWCPRMAITPEGHLLITTFGSAFRAVDLKTEDIQEVYQLQMPDDIVCMDDGTVITFGPGRMKNCYQQSS
jgi:WD40 repeat protein